VNADEPFLSPEEAAQLLRVSRTHINKLIDTGKLGEIQTEGPRRRIAKSAVLTYKAESKTRQAAGMATMVDATQRLGLYDAEASERRAALGVFLDDWEKEHGSITSVELDRAGKELSEPLLNASLHNSPEFHYSTLHREQKTEVGGDRSPTPPDCS
jgi:excisionase family DNA binding protein